MAPPPLHNGHILGKHVLPRAQVGNVGGGEWQILSAACLLADHHHHDGHSGWLQWRQWSSDGGEGGVSGEDRDNWIKQRLHTPYLQIS